MDLNGTSLANSFLSLLLLVENRVGDLGRVWERSPCLGPPPLVPVINLNLPHYSVSSRTLYTQDHLVSKHAPDLDAEAELFVPVQHEQGGVGHDDDHEGEHGRDGNSDDEADLGDAHGRHRRRH